MAATPIESEATRIIPFRDGAIDTGDADYFQTQLELLRSRAIAERVVQQMKLVPPPVTTVPTRPWWEELLRKESVKAVAPSLRPPRPRRGRLLTAFAARS